MRETINVYFSLTSVPTRKLDLDSREAPDWFIELGMDQSITGYGAFKGTQEEWKGYWKENAQFIFEVPKGAKGRLLSELKDDDVCLRTFLRVSKDSEPHLIV